MEEAANCEQKMKRGMFAAALPRRLGAAPPCTGLQPPFAHELGNAGRAGGALGSRIDGCWAEVW